MFGRFIRVALTLASTASIIVAQQPYIGTDDAGNLQYVSSALSHVKLPRPPLMPACTRIAFW